MAGTYRSEYTGAQIDASVAFGHNPDSTPTANSVKGVTSGGVKAAIDAAASASSDGIAAETAARQAADTTLQSNIDAETLAREQADNTLSAAVATKQDTLTFDDVPVQNSSNPVKSGGVWTKLKELNSAMQGGDADILAEMRENYARVDGAYETLTSGNAEQLLATQYVEDSVPYIFRPSGNHADIGDREFDTLVGGSIVWNQLMPTENADTAGTDVNVFARVTGEDNICTAGHKYFVSVDVTSLSNLADCRLRHPASQDLSLYTGKNQFIVDATSTDFEIVIQSLEFGTYVEVSLPANFAMICDLTLMLGSAVADYIYNLEAANTGAGVAYLLNLIPLLGGDYMAQNSGTMLSVNASAHETVGFNQWDEEWDNGTIDPTTGQNATGTNVRSKNYIPVIPGQTYYYKNGSGIKANLRYYDAEKNYIGYASGAVAANNTFVIPENTHFIRFSVLTTYGTSYKNDICINISWNGTRNGEYEPYEKRTYPLDNTVTLRGVPVVKNGKVRYDGDIYNADGTVERRYATVDMGTLAWERADSGFGFYRFFATLNEKANGNSNMICAAFPTMLLPDGVDQTDQSIKGNNANNIIYVRYDAYTDVATFKAAMSGVPLVFERATPATESATPYQSPQIVDDWGTERYVDYEYSIGQRPIPVPVGHDTKYPANLRDKVQHLPSLADSDGTYAIQQVGTNMSLTSLSLFGLLSSGSPELHRMIYRGKNLGTSFTAAQKAAIVNGSFDDLWLGDYWVIGGVTYVIADFDYWYNTGDTNFTKHHVVVIPAKNMYNAQMNATNTTVGGYYNSAMRGAEVDGVWTPYAPGCGLYNALTAFQNAFGDALLTHREYLCEAVTNGLETSGAWVDSIVDLPSEIMVYGTAILTPSPLLYTVDKSQMALMAANPKTVNTAGNYWLRNVASATEFAYLYDRGLSYKRVASYSNGIRPVAAIGG